MFPDNVNTVELVVEQTVAAPEILPDTDVRLTVIVAEAVAADPQTPLVTTAL